MMGKTKEHADIQEHARICAKILKSDENPPPDKIYFQSDSKEYKEALNKIERARINSTSNAFFDSVYRYMKLNCRISERQYYAVMFSRQVKAGYSVDDYSDMEWTPEYHDPYFDDIGCR